MLLIVRSGKCLCIASVIFLACGISISNAQTSEIIKGSINSGGEVLYDKSGNLQIVATLGQVSPVGHSSVGAITISSGHNTFTHPSIIISGPTEVTFRPSRENPNYSDAGAVALDFGNGDITSKITTANPVNVDASGTYSVLYNVVNSNGYAAAEAIRTVIVEKATIVIKGDKLVTHEAGTEYLDKGATAYDDGNDISESIEVKGSVNVNSVGIYTITYVVKDAAGNEVAEAGRTVNVVDTIAPVIALIGEKVLTHRVGDIFEDPGVFAYDIHDGNLTEKVIKQGQVDILNAGEYKIEYNVKDFNGNSADSVNRIVYVIDNIKLELRSVDTGRKQIVIELASEIGVNYILQSSEDLIEWTETVSIKATGNQTKFTRNNDIFLSPQTFYRIRVVHP